MQKISNPPSPAPPGIGDVIAAAGHVLTIAPDGWYADDAASVQAIITGYAGGGSELAWWQTTQINAVEAYLAGLIAAGYAYQGTLIAIDDASVGKITAMSAIASNTIAGLIATAWPASFVWLPQGNGAPLALATPQAMIAMGAAVGHYVSGCIQYAGALSMRIMSASTVSAVQAINPTAGWPAS